MRNISFFALLFFCTISSSNSLDSPDFSKIKKNDLSWNQWIEQIKIDLKKNEELKDSTINILDQLTFNPRVIELDRKQPEFKLTFDEYLKKVIGKKKKRAN